MDNTAEPLMTSRISATPPGGTHARGVVRRRETVIESRSDPKELMRCSQESLARQESPQ